MKVEINAMKSQEVNFQKSQKLLASRARPRPWSSLRACSASSFCDFRKMTFRDLTAFFSFLLQKKSCVFQLFLLRSIKAYLCANINFHSVDFSGRRPEEVISFF